jgi:hypothetical protein
MPCRELLLRALWTVLVCNATGALVAVAGDATE